MKIYHQVFFLLLITCLSSLCHSGILAGATRIIYQEQDREKSLLLANTNSYPILTQVWVDDGSKNPDDPHSPFVVLPPIFQMSAAEIKGLRLIYNTMALPDDIESVFWLNLYEIPATAKTQFNDNYLNLGMDTQLKVFFRPKQLKPLSIESIASQLTFSFVQQGLNQFIQINNPTPYHVTLLQINLSTSTQQTTARHPEMMLAPKQHKLYQIEQAHFNIIKNQPIQFVLIDDQGKSQPFAALVKN